MKNSKLTKILILTLTAALLACSAFAFGASAEGEAQNPEIEIAGRNVKYGATLAIQYAVLQSSVSDTATLEVYNGDPANGGEFKFSVKADAALCNDTVNGIEGPFYTYTVPGFAAADVCDEVYVFVKDGDNVSETMKYSPAEYFYERLFVDDVINPNDETETYQKALYLSYLEHAADAQDYFLNFLGKENVTLVTDRHFVNIVGGKVDGVCAGIYEPGSKVTITPDDASVKAWDITTYTIAADGTVTTATKTVAASAEVELTGHTTVEAGEIGAGMYYDVYGGVDYSAANAYIVAKDGYAFGTYNYSSSSFTGYTLYDKTTYETTDNRLHLNLATDPKDATNKVLWVHRHNVKDSVDFVLSNKKTGMTSGNCLVYETRFMLVDTTGITSVISGTETYDYIIDLQLSKTSGTTGAWAGSSGPVIGKIFAKINAEGGYTYYLSSNDHIDTSSTGGELKIGEWNTITIEVYDNGKEIQYVNGERINYKTVSTSGFDLDATYDSVLMNMRYGLTGGAGVYFDDTFVGFIDKECVAD
ncbi:MAG: hypothetical protein IJX92_01800 [Clostridia bacterium]|nr:hypothetical protein [Clostridia bacterium]